MARSLTILGQDLSSYVLSWGSIEETKEILLAKGQLFVGEQEVELDASTGIFKLGQGLMAGRSLLNVEAALTEDGVDLFRGPIRQLSVDKAEQKATIRIENYLTKLTNRVPTLTQSGVNPAEAMLALLLNVGLESITDVNSFLVAGGLARAAGATIDVAYEGKTTTVLDALQDICDLASINVFMRDGRITASAFKPYQGDQAGLRGVLTTSYVISFGVLETKADALQNVVKVRYGASSEHTATDPVSINAMNGEEYERRFDTNTGEELAVPDLTSAAYFANRYLLRSSTLRYTLGLKADTRVLGTPRIGDRYLVTDIFLGLSGQAFEVIETHRQINSSEVELLLVTID